MDIRQMATTVSGFFSKNWKYVSLALFILLCGMVAVHYYSTNKLKSKIIDCQESQVEVPVYIPYTDTIYQEKVKKIYTTKKEFTHDTTLVVQVDTMQVEVEVHDTMWLPVEHSMYTSVLDTDYIKVKADIYYTGIEAKLDSINYDVVFTKKKKCCWIKRLFNKCQ